MKSLKYVLKLKGQIKTKSSSYKLQVTSFLAKLDRSLRRCLHFLRKRNSVGLGPSFTNIYDNMCSLLREAEGVGVGSCGIGGRGRGIHCVMAKKEYSQGAVGFYEVKNNTLIRQLKA
jgi:hypothetical protein